MIFVMSTELLEHLRRVHLASRSFAAGAFIFHRNDPIENLHVVRSGAIRLVRYQSDG